ncbi:MAG: ATP-binding protein [Coriobacteriia bacterium]|nr:ATP-binding protein [Coriobacteriia bacterium]
MPSGNSKLALISIGRELTFTNAQSYIDKARKLADAGHTKYVVDFSGTQYVDSSGYGFLLYLHKLAKRNDAKLQLINVPNHILRTFEVIRFSEGLNFEAKHSAEEELSAQPAKAPLYLKTIKVPQDPSKMAQVRNQVRDILDQFGLEESRVFDLVLALGEALGNAFDHGCALCGQTKIFVTLSAYDDRYVIEVSDNGKGLEITDGFLPEPSETRGRGIRMMYVLVDSVEISKKPHGEGTVVKLVKLSQ